MTLSLPEDLEVFAADYDQLTNPAVYCLELSKPENPAGAWDDEYDHRPSWFEDFEQAECVLYVGAAKNALSRLEDHRDGRVRQTVLTRLCDVQGLRECWFYDDADKAFLRESQHALEVDKQTRESVFVRQS